MAVYSIAQLNVEYDCLFDVLKSRSKKYLSEDTQAQFKLQLDDDYFSSRRSMYPFLSDEMLEYMGMGTAFYKKLLDFDGFMLHASAVEMNSKCYLFSAPSGVGKSTHTSLWLKEFPNAKVINDDKPAIRKIGENFLAFGTPFSGKNDISQNSGYPIKGVCFIDRGENCIEKITPSQALTPLFNQTIRPSDESKMDNLCKIADEFLKNIPCYAMRCDISGEAVKMAYEKMNKR